MRPHQSLACACRPCFEFDVPGAAEALERNGVALTPETMKLVRDFWRGLKAYLEAWTKGMEAFAAWVDSMSPEEREALAKGLRLKE